MSGTGRHVLFVVLAIVTVFLAAFNGGRAANPLESPPALQERKEALNRLAGLDEQEKALVTELLDWDVRIEAARQDHERLTLEIPVARQALEDAESSLAVTREQLSAEQDKLGRWVNFLYRYGAVAYLEVILGATDFNDFVARAESVKSIIVSQVRLLDEVRTLQHSQEEQSEIKRQAQAELSAKSTALAQRIADMDRDRAGREAFLAELKQQHAGLAERVIGYETALYQSINPLRYLLSHLDTLPWFKLSPEKFSLSGNRLRFEFSDQEVNRVFFEQGDQNLASLSVHFSSGLFSISGCADAVGTNFTVEGSFALEGDGKVCFQPASGLLAGLPVSGEVLKFIASSHSLTFDLGSRTQGYRLTEIRPEEGRLIVVLAPSPVPGT